MSIRYKTSRFSAGTKKIWYKRGVPRWKSTGAIIMKNCREACSRGCHLSCRIIITPKYEQTMNKPNFFVLFSQLSTSAFLFIVNIHNIPSGLLPQRHRLSPVSKACKQFLKELDQPCKKTLSLLFRDPVVRQAEASLLQLTVNASCLLREIVGVEVER